MPQPQSAPDPETAPEVSGRVAAGAARRARFRRGILDAAYGCLAAPEGDSARIEDIRKAADVARGTFYNHFKDMDALRAALLDELTAPLVRGIAGTAPERLSRLVRRTLDAARQDAGMGRALIRAAMPGRPFGTDGALLVQEAIAEGVAAGAIGTDLPDVARDFVCGAVASALVTVTRGDAPDDYPERMARQVLLALRVSPAEATRVAALP